MEQASSILGFSLVVGFVLFGLAILVSATTVVLVISIGMLRDLFRKKDK